MRGLYVHIPFCKSKCPYCHFYSETSFLPHDIGEYFKACLKDAEHITNKSFDTLYLGGGTPSAIPAQMLAKFIEDLLHTIRFSGAEFTVEANPESVTEDFLSFIKDSPVTRVSLGVQSFDDAALRLLGRIHKASHAEKACINIKKTGVDLNTDMIFDIPSVNPEIIINTAQTIVNIDPSHVSAYSYSAEDRNYLSGFDTDKTLFFEIENFFKKNGYSKYETSNFSQKGKESLHNKIYWNGGEYIGVGASAHSMIYNEAGCRIRYSRSADIKMYIKNPQSYDIYEKLPMNEAAKETILTALRTADGADFDNIEKMFGKIDKNLVNNIDRFVKLGMLQWEGKCLKTTSKGAAVLDSLSASLW